MKFEPYRCMDVDFISNLYVIKRPVEKPTSLMFLLSEQTKLNIRA